MGNSRAYPVLRTADAAAAYTAAKRLCALLARCDDDVWLFAELRTVREVREMAALVPEAVFEYADSRTDPAAGDWLTFDLDVATAEDADLAAHLPLEIMEDAPRGVEDRFVAALGEGMAGLDWHGMWPHEPEAGLRGSPQYDGVQIVFHGDCAQWGDEWTAEHTVFVHVTNWGDLPRARMLAAHIGSEVLGEAQLGW